MNKRLLGIFIAVAVAVVVIVVCCVMFLTGSVEVKTAGDLTLDDDKVNAIVSQSGIKKGESIFALDKASATSAVEKANPYLKVVNIERKFPNKVVIYIAERSPVLAIPVETEEGESALYALVDNELKILGVATESEISGLTPVSNFTISGGEESAGSFLGEDADGLAGVVEGAESVTFVSNRFNDFIKNIEFSKSNVRVKTNTGVTFVLKNDGNVKSMFVGAYTYYSNSADGSKERTSGYIFFNGAAWEWSENQVN